MASHPALNDAEINGVALLCRPCHHFCALPSSSISRDQGGLWHGFTQLSRPFSALCQPPLSSKISVFETLSHVGLCSLINSHSCMMLIVTDAGSLGGSKVALYHLTLLLERNSIVKSLRGDIKPVSRGFLAGRRIRRTDSLMNILELCTPSIFYSLCVYFLPDTVTNLIFALALSPSQV